MRRYYSSTVHLLHLCGELLAEEAASLLFFQLHDAETSLKDYDVLRGIAEIIGNRAFQASAQAIALAHSRLDPKVAGKGVLPLEDREKLLNMAKTAMTKLDKFAKSSYDKNTADLAKFFEDKLSHFTSPPRAKRVRLPPFKSPAAKKKTTTPIRRKRTVADEVESVDDKDEASVDNSVKAPAGKAPVKRKRLVRRTPKGESEDDESTSGDDEASVDNSIKVKLDFAAELADLKEGRFARNIKIDFEAKTVQTRAQKK